MSEANAVLFANEAFYRAFESRLISDMESVWSARAEIACIHPGWPPIFGRGEVIETWRRILENETEYTIECHQPKVVINGDSAMVLCYEKLPDGWLVATNMFVREGRTWKMVHHQAGPVMEAPKEKSSEERTGMPRVSIH